MGQKKFRVAQWRRLIDLSTEWKTGCGSENLIFKDTVSFKILVNYTIPIQYFPVLGQYNTILIQYNIHYNCIEYIFFSFDKKTSVIIIDLFRKTHILNQYKTVLKHIKLFDWSERITFVSCERYLYGWQAENAKMFLVSSKNNNFFFLKNYNDPV